MQYGFKFEIGQTVRHVTAAQTDDKWGMRGPYRHFIVERRLQECPGGVQRYYHCRLVSIDGSVCSELNVLNEIELDLSEPFQEEHKK